MKIDARLSYDKVSYADDFDAHMVVSVTAPSTSAGSRPSICVIPVIDVSPSMQGEKFEYAKRSILKLIDHLHTGDYCGLIQFSGRAEVIAAPVKITPDHKEDLRRKVGALRIGNATNVADALLLGLQVANHMDLSAEVITRVILFTDGDSNTGPAIRPKDILALVEPNLGLASVSAFGYGEDVKQDFLADLAKLGKANYAFVRNPDDALSAFGKELGGLLSTYATDLQIEISPVSGHLVSKVITDVEAEEEEVGNEITIKIPDILGEETRHIVLGFKLKAVKNAFPRPVTVADISMGFDVLDANGRKERKTLEVKPKVFFVKPGDEDTEPNKEVDVIVGLAQIIRAQIEAEERAKRGDYRGAMQHMQDIGDSVSRRGHKRLSRLANNVTGKLQDRGTYAAAGAYLASVSRGGTRGMGVASYEVSAAAELGELGVQMSNSAQTITADSFNADPPLDVIPPLDVVPPLSLGLESLQDAVASLPVNSGSWVTNGPPLPKDPPKTPAAKPRSKIKQSKTSTRW